MLFFFILKTTTDKNNNSINNKAQMTNKVIYFSAYLKHVQFKLKHLNFFYRGVAERPREPWRNGPQPTGSRGVYKLREVRCGVWSYSYCKLL